MKELKLIDRVVVEIKCDEDSQSRNTQMAALLQDVSEQIMNGMKGNESLHTSPIGIHTEVLWERECTDFGFRMGNRSLISDAYYGAKEYFEVCSVSKEDIEHAGFDASKLTAEDMEHIANEQGELICEGCDYWNGLDEACRQWDVPRKDDDVHEVIPGTQGMLNELSIRE